MLNREILSPYAKPLIVGSIGEISYLKNLTPESLATQCDIAEVRLDLFHREFKLEGNQLWKHLLPFPLLFTARCHSEGSPFEIDVKTRCEMLRKASDDAKLVDIEVDSTYEMAELIDELNSKQLAWIASSHHFHSFPSKELILKKSQIAHLAGASAFKLATILHDMSELKTLVEIQKMNLGIVKSTMGMGALAPVSRLLCAQHGSVLNYGYLGASPTAPGQWEAKILKDSVSLLEPIL